MISQIDLQKIEKLVDECFTGMPKSIYDYIDLESRRELFKEELRKLAPQKQSKDLT